MDPARVDRNDSFSRTSLQQSNDLALRMSVGTFSESQRTKSTEAHRKIGTTFRGAALDLLPRSSGAIAAKNRHAFVAFEAIDSAARGHRCFTGAGIRQGGDLHHTRPPSSASHPSFTVQSRPVAPHHKE